MKMCYFTSSVRCGEEFKPCTACLSRLNKRNKMHNTNKTPGKAENKSNTD